MPFWRCVSPFGTFKPFDCRCRWPRGLRRGSAAARLLRLWVRVPPGAWIYVSCECSVLSGRCRWDELITRAEDPYWLWCVVVCDLETSWMRRPWPTGGPLRQKKELTNFHDTLHSYYAMSAFNFSAIFKDVAPTQTCEATVTLVPRNLGVQKYSMFIECWRICNFVRIIFLSNVKTAGSYKKNFFTFWLDVEN